MAKPYLGRPGERLNDGELAQRLGVSRTPVREALARLEEAGLVHTKPGRYTMVSPLDMRALRGAHSVATVMHELAVREALPNLSAVELDAMRAANARFAEALRANDVDAALAADDDFHGVAVPPGPTRRCGRCSISSRRRCGGWAIDRCLR